MAIRRIVGVGCWAVLGLAVLVGGTAALGLWGSAGQPAWLQGLQVQRAAASLPSPAPAAGARKCRSATAVLYTNGPCPPGSREEALAPDRLSVVPAAPVPQPAGPQAAGPAEGSGQGSLLRQWAGSDDQTPRLRDQMREQAIERATR